MAMLQPFRAFDVNNRPLMFGVEDIPVFISSTRIALTNRPNSPLIRANTVSRRLPNTQLGEGDSVLYRGRLYQIVYNRGFLLWDTHSDSYIQTNVVDFPDISYAGITTVPNTRLQLRHEDVVFQLSAILGPSGDGKMYISHCPTAIDPNNVQIAAGFTFNGKRVFYGDILQGHELTMWRGRPVIKTEDGIIEYPTKLLL